MQKAAFAITIPHFFLPISTYISEANHTSITSRFCVHETLQINQLNFLVFGNYLSIFLVFKKTILYHLMSAIVRNFCLLLEEYHDG